MDGDEDGTATVDIGADEFVPPVVVGGEAYTANIIAILMPWVALLVLLAGGLSLYGWRRRRAHS